MRPIKSFKKSVGSRPPKKKFVIFTEGKNTEPAYFRALKRTFPGALVEFELFDAAGVPLTIAKKAADRIAAIKNRSRRSQRDDSFADNDEVWAVFDVDEHPNLNDAKQICKSSGVGLAISNPCFEVWLILHFCDFHRPDDRHAVQKFLQKLVDDYDPRQGKTTDCGKLMDNLPIAESRAEAQEAARIKEGSENSAPSTSVYRLTRAIREAAGGAKDGR